MRHSNAHYFFWKEPRAFRYCTSHLMIKAVGLGWLDSSPPWDRLFSFCNVICNFHFLGWQARFEELAKRAAELSLENEKIKMVKKISQENLLDHLCFLLRLLSLCSSVHTGPIHLILNDPAGHLHGYVCPIFVDISASTVFLWMGSFYLKFSVGIL